MATNLIQIIQFFLAGKTGELEYGLVVCLRLDRLLNLSFFYLYSHCHFLSNCWRVVRHLGLGCIEMVLEGIWRNKLGRVVVGMPGTPTVVYLVEWPLNLGHLLLLFILKILSILSKRMWLPLRTRHGWWDYRLLLGMSPFIVIQRPMVLL